MHNAPPPPTLYTYFLPVSKALLLEASGQRHRETSGVRAAPRITMVMPKQCLTAKPNTKFDSQLTLTRLPTPFPLLSHKKKKKLLRVVHNMPPRHPLTHDPPSRDALIGSPP